ncbi:Heterodisulfide reductase subunit D-like protein [Citrifermentans bremense]|uniref:F420-non-reducing hydrogenase iron-sulfur subunit D domain-containing protein n=2 Tax=Citrifermentans bremense TaxID=60035 RepID=A0A6S6M923_9BACT|nr:Heterodisulfide reductase subunit D-like protein [Citrifermentans bremense]
MCTGRVDLAFILRAFRQGADGVFIGGCWPGECHYVTEGNYDVLKNVHIAKKMLQRIGINPDRLRLEWISASEGMRYAEVMNEFGKNLKELGALGKGEGIEERSLKLRMEAAYNLVPYVKLVERERIRQRFKTEEEYEAYFASEELESLFDDLVTDNLAVSQMTLLLKEKPLSTAEIASALNLSAADVNRHIKTSSRKGLVKYDEDLKAYALA